MSFCLVGLLILLAGCRAERVETQDDLSRYVDHNVEQYPMTLAAIQRFARTNVELIKPLDGDIERFLVWRKYQWWNLEEDLAILWYHEWDQISTLMREVGRFYGYNLEKWPKAADSAVRFYALAGEEWRNLLQDVSIFVEYNVRKRYRLSDQLREAYNRLEWEWVNLQIDVASFLNWREREYAKLSAQARAYWKSQIDLVDDFKQDVGRYVEHNVQTQPRLLTIDVSNWLESNIEQLPDLNDDLYRFWLAHTTDIKLAADARRSWQMARHEAVRLRDAVKRYGANQAAETKALLAAFERWLQTYEREFGPMRLEVQRFWRYNLSKRELLMEDVRRFYALGEEEFYELQADLHRFIAYGGTEWQALKGNFRRFFTNDRQAAFGDRSIPFPGDTYGRYPDDDPIWRSRYGNTDY